MNDYFEARATVNVSQSREESRRHDAIFSELDALTEMWGLEG
jgi:hypothetical protein